MGRFVLEDLYGRVPVTLFANQLQQFGGLLEEEAVVLVKGQVRMRGSELELSVEEIKPLTLVTARPPAALELRLDAGTPRRQVLALRDLLAAHPGEVPVRLCVALPDRWVDVSPRDSCKVSFDERLVEAVEGLLGRGCLQPRYAEAS
jgi:DNA polymerase-3 subunit alpha